MQHPEPHDVSDPMIEISERPLGAIVERGGAVRAHVATDDLISAAFEQHAPRLTAFAIAAVRDRDAADDLVAETFLRFVREARNGRVPDNIGGWLYRVCGNLVTSRGRRLTVARRALSRLLERGDADSPEAHAIRHDLNDRTVAALGTLAPDARVALLMAAEGHDMASIAAAIGRTPSATRTYVCRSRVHLRDAIAASEAGGPGGWDGPAR